MLKLRKGSKVLDVGCGTGYASLRFASFFENDIDVVGIDFTKNEINLGRRYMLACGRHQDFLEGNALSLPFKSNSFDAAFCINLLHHIEDHRGAICELCRVARKVCCAEPNALNPMQRRYQKTEAAKRAGDTKAFFLRGLKNDFRDAGLKNIRAKRIIFVYPKLSEEWIKRMIKVEPLMEKMPVLNLIGGSVVVCGEK